MRQRPKRDEPRAGGVGKRLRHRVTVGVAGSPAAEFTDQPRRVRFPLPPSLTYHVRRIVGGFRASSRLARLLSGDERVDLLLGHREQATGEVPEVLGRGRRRLVAHALTNPVNSL